MPFGLSNAQACFQRNMDSLIDEVKQLGHQGVSAYVDNILVFSETFEEHMLILKDVFEVMKRARLTLRADKCEFAKESICFLGFVVDGIDVKPDPDNINKLKAFKRPSTRRQLRQFLGCSNF